MRLLPILPWIAGLALAAQAVFDPLARRQMAGSWPAVVLYLAGWSIAVALGMRLWRGVTAALPGAISDAPPPCPADPGARLAVPLLAVAALVYWNGAVLDPLQFRGFPDFVTQMTGARRLLAGELPYDPTIRVWTDVNLPPITLLLLFAPFAPLTEFAGKLVFFALNHAAFFVGLAVLLRWARPREQAAGMGWAALVVAMAAVFQPWHDSLRLGQQNGIVFLFLAVSAAAFVHRRDTLAGGALALALIGKPSAALLGLYFLFARRWRAAAAAAGAGLLAFLATLPWAGVANWRYYLIEKAPQILAGTPQQSNVALLALHARLFLPRDVLGSFDAMPPVPAAQLLTRCAQVAGVAALWLLVNRPARHLSRTVALLEFGVALVLSLSLVGHAWQSYTTWLAVAFVPLADARLWQDVPPRYRAPLALLAGGSYAALALDDVALYKVVGTTTPAAAVFASLPNVALLVLASTLALLARVAGGTKTESRGTPVGATMARAVR